MKKILFGVIAFFLSCSIAWGAGTVVQTGPVRISSDMSVVTLTCVGDSSDGGFPATALTAFYGWVDMVVTDPGTTAPTDDWDCTFPDSDACDIMGGALANRDTSTSEQTMPLIGSAYGPRFVNGVITCTITGNSVNSANIVIKIYIID